MDWVIVGWMDGDDTGEKFGKGVLETMGEPDTLLYIVQLAAERVLVVDSVKVLVDVNEDIIV